VTARTPAEAIAAVQRHGPAISPEVRAAALELLRDMLAAAAQHGVGLGDFDYVCDLPGAAVDVVVAKQRQP
jgi:hypothetical protein